MRLTFVALRNFAIVAALAIQLSQFGGSVSGQSQVDPNSKSSANPGMSETGWSNELVRRKLNKTHPLVFDETPWKTVEQNLEAALEIDIILSSSAADDSLSKDEPITCNLKGVTVRNGLRLMLVEKNATFIVRKGAVIIISKDDTEDPRFMTNFTMDVNSLLEQITNNETARIGKPRARKDGSETGELISAESLLTDLVQSTFQANRWEGNNGTAKFNVIAGKAVVLCDDEMADGLRDFLKDLEFQIAKK